VNLSSKQPCRHRTDQNFFNLQEQWVEVEGSKDKFQLGRIVENMRVKIDGLNSMPQYNGTFGTVEGFNSENNRWKVRMDFDYSLKSLTEKNLSFSGIKQGIRVKIDGLN